MILSESRFLGNLFLLSELRCSAFRYHFLSSLAKSWPFLYRGPNTHTHRDIFSHFPCHRTSAVFYTHSQGIQPCFKKLQNSYLAILILRGCNFWKNQLVWTQALRPESIFGPEGNLDRRAILSFVTVGTVGTLSLRPRSFVIRLWPIFPLAIFACFCTFL